MDKELVENSIKILQLIYSFKSFNKLMLNFEKEISDIAYLNNNADKYINTDHFSGFYEQIISLVVLCAIRARRLIENNDIQVSKYIKYTSIGLINSKNSISYENALSKIIHSKELFVETEGDYKAYSYDVDKNNPKTKFTGKLVIHSTSKGGDDELISIDIEQFCLNNISLSYLLS